MKCCKNECMKWWGDFITAIVNCELKMACDDHIQCPPVTYPFSNVSNTTLREPWSFV